MAALHSALQALGPCRFSDVPNTAPELDLYLQNLFRQSQLILESVPIPPPDEKAETRPAFRTNPLVASNASEVLSSSARSLPPVPEYAALQSEWGKPIKLGAKENPLGMAVYKTSGRDSRGSWFARRSVLEGIGFSKFKKSLQMEFPETLAVGRAPGEGNIRGIGGDQRLGELSVPGTGRIEVFQLSAQFPGPTTPRDFVTLLVTSSSGMRQQDESSRSDISSRHYMVISKPCDHSEARPRDGYVRGNYESLEFIREVPRRPKRTMSSLDLRRLSGGNRNSLENEAVLGNAGETEPTTTKLANCEGGRAKDSDAATMVRDNSRRRGKTISVSELRANQIRAGGDDHDDMYDPEANPVEWIMVTRSDPGGSVPRFMVERGTPASIVADASKFLDWSCQKQHEEEDSRGASAAASNGHRESFTNLEANGYLAGVNTGSSKDPFTAETQSSTTEPDLNRQRTPADQSGIFSNVADALSAGSQVMIGRLASQGVPGQHESTPNVSVDGANNEDEKGDSDTLSSLSFASADSHLEQELHRPGSSRSSAAQTTQSSSSVAIWTNGPAKPKDSSFRYGAEQEKEFYKFQARRAALDAKLASARQKWQNEEGLQTAKEKEAMRKAEEKHGQEVKKQEAKYNKEVEKLEQRRRRDAQRDRDRVEKKTKQSKQSSVEAEDTNDGDLSKRQKETERQRDEAREEASKLRVERDIWREQIGDLQRENTALVAKLGRLEKSTAEPSQPHLQAASLLTERPRGTQ